MYGYGNRNRRIQREAALIQQRNLAIQAEIEKYKQRHISEAQRANDPLTN